MQLIMKQIGDYVDGHRGEMLDLWRELVNSQAYSTEVERVNAVMRRLCEIFENEGMNCRMLDSKGNACVLVAEDGTEREDSPIVLSGHVDTVFYHDAFPANPFKIEDDTAYGPGVMDMKGGVVMMLYIVKALRFAGYRARPIKIILCGDEEINHAGAISAQLMIDEARGAFCALNLEGCRIDNFASVGRKGNVDCHVKVTGVSGHVGNDFLTGRNAIEEMAHKVLALQKLTDYDNGLVVSVDVIHGGTVSNVIPSSCTIEIDSRFNRSSDLEAVKQKILDACAQTYIEGTSTKVVFVNEFPAFERTRDNVTLLELLNEAARENGFEELEGRFLGGNSDAAYLAKAGIPVLCSLGVRGAGAHTEEECAFVESLFERTKLLAAFITKLGSCKKI